MKKIYYSIAVAAMMFQSCATSETKESTEEEVKTEMHDDHEVEMDDAEELVFVDGYEYHGIKDMDSAGAVSIAEMQASIATTGSFEGKINATLAGVCRKAGCWVTIDNPAGDPIRVVFGEHAFFVPTETEVGRAVIIEGFAQLDTTSIDLQKHFLDDAVEAGETVTQAEYDSITEDLIEVSFNASGILIK